MSPVQAQPQAPDHADAGGADIDRAFAAAQISPWSTREKIARALWMIARGTLFRWSWHNWYGWRRLVLRTFGARIGTQVVIRPTARIEIPWLLSIGDYSSIGDFAIVYNLGPVTIGRRVSISQWAHLCAGTHDYTKWNMPLLRPPITIGDDAWLAAETFIGPGVNVGNGAIVGARAAAFRDLKPWTIYAGSPARPLRARPPMQA
jgi:putative colanic acid biosynthesis acetyltransferase WcaF